MDYVKTSHAWAQHLPTKQLDPGIRNKPCTLKEPKGRWSIRFLRGICVLASLSVCPARRYQLTGRSSSVWHVLRSELIDIISFSIEVKSLERSSVFPRCTQILCSCSAHIVCICMQLVKILMACRAPNLRRTNGYRMLYQRISPCFCNHIHNLESWNVFS